MASIYNNSPNDYSSEFRSVTLTDSGTFELQNEEVPKVSLWNDGGQPIRVFKTNDYTTTTSGTSNAYGTWIGVEDGVTFNMVGLGNSNQISVQLQNYNKYPYELKYIVFK